MADELQRYHDGWPEQQGWYDVLVGGEPDRLRHWVCAMSGRHEWVDLDGQYVREQVVLWTGEPAVRYL